MQQPYKKREVGKDQKIPRLKQRPDRFRDKPSLRHQHKVMKDEDVRVVTDKEPVRQHQCREQHIHDDERRRAPPGREEHQRQKQAEDGSQRGQRNGERARRMAQRVHRQHAEGGPVEHVGDGIVHRNELEPDCRGDNRRKKISAYKNRPVFRRRKHLSTITYLR